MVQNQPEDVSGQFEFLGIRIHRGVSAVGFFWQAGLDEGILDTDDC